LVTLTYNVIGALAVVERTMPALAARLQFFKSGDRSSAKDFLDGARFPPQQWTADAYHLATLARDLGEWNTFKSRLGKRAPPNMVQEIEAMPLLPTDEVVV
jgi:hypothetical protein